MTRRPLAQRGRGGRPPQGRTAQVWGRVSPERRQEIEDLAEVHDLALAQVVAALIDTAFEHLDEVVMPKQPTSNQRELPLKAG